MGKKILYCATVDYHFEAFHLPYMKWFKEQGWSVDVAACGQIALPYTDNKYNIPIQRSPFSKSNIIAYKQLKKLIERNNYNIIHCHTPIGGVLTRLAARQARRKGTKVVYTAHGFHFCKGAPLANWLLYYPIEKYLAHYTDNLITINNEDYKLATKHRFKAGMIHHIFGVGINTEKFKAISKNKKNNLKKSFGYNADDFLLFNAAEFNKNKNQQFLLKSFAHLKKVVPNARLLLAGEGPLLKRNKQLAKQLRIDHLVHFLGKRNDIDQLLPMCDLAVAASFREGLPVNVMEAMACELPVVAVANRGHRELIFNNKTGWLLPTWNVEEFSEKVQLIAQDKQKQNQFGLHGRKRILEKYSLPNVLFEKMKIYQMYMHEQEEARWIAH